MMDTLTAIRRFRPVIAGQGSRFAGAALLLGVAAGCEIAAVFVLADVIDSALADGLGRFGRTAAIWLAITALSTVADYYGQVIAVGVSEQVVLRLRDNLFAHVLRLHPVVHRKLGLGNLVARHSGDLEAVEFLVGSGAMQLIIAGANTIGLVIAAFIMSWEVALVAVAAVPLLWGASATFARRQVDVTRRERTANAAISDTIESALIAHETTVAYNQQDAEIARLHRHGSSWRCARIAQTRVEAGFGAVMGFGQVVVTLAIALAGVWQIREGRLSVGELISLTGYLGMLYPKMQQMADARLAVAAAVVSADRVAEVLDLVPSEQDAPNARAVGMSDAFATGGVAVTLDSVTLIRGTATVLDDVSLDYRSDEITALVGPSGVGKSSVASLLCRFEHPDTGSIRLGGTDFTELTGHYIRSQVTLLPQSTVIRAGSIADNIAYGNPDADTAQIRRAAMVADADAFVRGLPDGYETLLQDGGLTLSGGQRQRIAMARAIIRDTPVLILDEPTAGLDDATVTRIRAPLRRLASGRTTLLITHDPRVVDLADRVVELRDGRLRERTPDPEICAVSERVS